MDLGGEGEVQASWRSWFWNLFLMVVMLGFSLVLASTAFSVAALPAAIGFGVFALLAFLGAVRAPILGVFAGPRGIVVRKFVRTVTIPWGEVEKIVEKSPAGGISGVAGAGSPVIVQRRSNGEFRRIELDVLGGYGVSPIRPTPAEKAVAALNSYLADWRSRSSN